MICRRVCRSLSAYIDRELPPLEREIITDHLEICVDCRAEYEALSQTKHLVSSLRTRVARDEWVSLLEPENSKKNAVPLIRTRPLIATALLSLLGLCLGTNRLTHSLSAVATRTPESFASLRPHFTHSLQEEYTVGMNGQGIYNRYHTFQVSVGSLHLMGSLARQHVAPVFYSVASEEITTDVNPTSYPTSYMPVSTSVNYPTPLDQVSPDQIAQMRVLQASPQVFIPTSNAASTFSYALR